MKIIYEDFILETEPIGGRIDVSRKKRKTAKADDVAVKAGRKKIGEVYTTTEYIGFGMTLDKAMEKIIMLKLHEKKDTTDLRGFIREFKRIKAELENTLKL